MVNPCHKAELNQCCSQFEFTQHLILMIIMWKTKTKSEIVYKRIPDCVNSHFRVEIIHNFKFAPSPFNPAIIQLQRVYIYVQFRRKVHKRHRPANKYTSIILVIFRMFFSFLTCVLQHGCVLVFTSYIWVSTLVDGDCN